MFRKYLIVLVVLALSGLAGWASAEIEAPAVGLPDEGAVADSPAVTEAVAAANSGVQLAGPDELHAAFAATGQAADPAQFGVYSILPVGESLYLGLGAARPAEYDGALLARLDGEHVSPLAKLDEQGFIGMTLAGGRIYIPGADPMDGWEAGNLYVHNLGTGTTTKLRTLPNTIHAWQVRVEADGRLRVTVGRYLPEQQSDWPYPGADWVYRGGILTSTDDGRTWTADDSQALGMHRTYDLIEGPAQDVALVDDADISGCQLATRSHGGGASGAGVWTRGAAYVLCRLRLLSDPNGRRVLAVGADARSLVVAGSEHRLRLPFAVELWAYHWQALVSRTVYVLAADGRVLATQDFRAWTTVAQFGQPLVSVTYWPARQALVVATKGAAGAVYLVPLAQ